jgi:hypothetical protein
MKKRKTIPKYILRACRGRLGVEDNDNDISRDADILAMPPRKIVELYYGWTLGDGSWSDSIIDVINAVYGIKLK